MKHRTLREVRTRSTTLWTLVAIRRQSHRARIATLAALATVLLTAVAHSAVAHRTAAPRHAWPATILRWMDGDTAVLATPSGVERVRLIGIDAPEASPSERARGQARRLNTSLWNVVRLGLQARDYAQQLAPPSTRVFVETDVQARDRYGRLLAYLWLPDGRLLQEEILRAGRASLLTIPPNVKHTERLLNAWREARKSGRGLSP
jgi:micrococcal nuclease